tara:strand:- start:547 stop:774 length:228 start_codon:yes stop_codon:yes gene_type:complete
MLRLKGPQALVLWDKVLCNKLVKLKEDFKVVPLSLIPAVKWVLFSILLNKRLYSKLYKISDVRVILPVKVYVHRP